MKILITGGLGFAGSHLALNLKQDGHEIRVLDNLRRRGSELNLNRLQKNGITFFHGDVRMPSDLSCASGMDLILEASAEPSVLAGFEDPDYLLSTNLVGAMHCLEAARRHQAAFLFLSTSRVYPVDALLSIPCEERATRLEWKSLKPSRETLGRDDQGLLLQMPPEGEKTLYGAAKLSAELLCTEYARAFGVPTLINRCGVLAGPWQFGKVDQGFVALWAAAGVYDFGLRHIGYEGSGKQVRDILHIEDLCRLIRIQLRTMSAWQGEIFHASGGKDISVSLLELGHMVESLSGKRLQIEKDPEMRAGDVPILLLSSRKTRETFGWAPEKGAQDIVSDVYGWIFDHQEELRMVMGR